MMNELSAAAAIERWFRAAVEAVEPASAVAFHLEHRSGQLLVDGVGIDVPGKLIVVAIGKAAAGMADGAVTSCGETISDGIVLTKDGHLDCTPARFRSFEAAHPVPDQRGVDATTEILQSVSSAGCDDVVLVLLSGGGSALLEAPVDGVTLDDIARTTDLMLRAGAPIQHLNAVRTPLSRVKGGGLRRVAPGARFVTLMLSDVLGNDPSVIASGPTVETAFSREGAIELIERYDLRDEVPVAVIDALSHAPDESGSIGFERDVVVAVGDNAAAVAAFAGAATEDGITCHNIWEAKEGEARILAAEWIAECLAAPDDIDLLLGGGEATVTVRGEGIGGRNTEFALAAALELERRGRHDWIVASLATDGQDGATGVAGAISTAATIARARDARIDPADCLARNDSLNVFEMAGGAIVTGPTGTNVNDLYVALRLGRSR
jgi:hydroxypyruvate reductase